MFFYILWFRFPLGVPALDALLATLAYGHQVQEPLGENVTIAGPEKVVI